MVSDKNGVEIKAGYAILHDLWPDEVFTVSSIDEYGVIFVEELVDGRRGSFAHRGSITVARASGSPPRAGDGAEDGANGLERYQSGEVPCVGDTITNGTYVAIVLSAPRAGERFGFRWKHPTEWQEQVGQPRYWRLLYRGGAQGRVTVTAPAYVPPGGVISAHVEPAPPLTFPLCPRCHERMPGAECGQPACAQVRKWAEMRKAEEGTRERYVAFHETVTRVVAEEAPRAKVVTDMTGDTRYPSYCHPVAWLDFGNGVKRTIAGDQGSNGVAWDVRATIDDAMRELGKRVVGGGR